MSAPPAFDENYQSVAERIKLFRDKYPEGTLVALDPAKPFEIVTAGGQSYVAVAAVAKRTPDDPAGGMGLAWCPLPGYDEYTRNSEIQNAQTSAWGRAIIAVLAADATKIASKEEVQSAQSHRAAPAPTAPNGSAATETATSVKPAVAPNTTDPSQEEYNAAVIAESLRLMNDPHTTYTDLRDVWQVLTQARLSTRRVAPPAGMEPDGDGMVAIAAAIAYVGKERKVAAEAAPPAEPVAEPADEAQTALVEEPAAAPRRGRKVAVGSE